MKLFLSEIDVECIIGERPDERVRPQRLSVDAELEIGDAAASSDDLADTVDYARLSERIRAALVDARCLLIERAAKVAHAVCKAESGVRAARVRVTKRGSVPGLGAAAAEFADAF